MAIQFIGSATGVTSATLPAHQADDLIIAFAFRDGSTTRPTLPSGWTNIRDDAGTTCSARLAFRIAANNSTVSGTWTNATSVIFLVYRGALSTPIGNAAIATGSSTTVTYNTVGVSTNNWVLGFAGHRSANVDLIAPDGMTNRAYVEDATDEAAAHDTTTGVDEWTTKDTSVGGTASGWITYTLEVKNLVNASTSVSGLELEIFTFPYQTASEWYAWFLGERGLSGEGLANYAVTGQESNTEIGEVTAEGQTAVNASVAIEGLDLSAQIQDISVIASSTKIITGEQASIEAGEIFQNASALTIIEGVQANSSIEQTNQVGNANANVLSVSANSDLGVISVNVDDSSTISLNGVSLQSQLGFVSASGTGEMQMVPGQISYKLPKLNATTRINGLTLQSEVTNPKASGTIIIDNTAKILSIEAVLEAKKVNAIGVLDVHDDDLILLLAA
jgi:hypothetical protein